MRTSRGLPEMTRGRGLHGAAALSRLGPALPKLWARAACSLLVAAIVLACASTPASEDTKAHASAAELPAGASAVVVDEDLARETTPLLRALIRTGALGDGQAAAVRLVADRLQAAGLAIELQRVGQNSGVNLLARLPGSDPKAKPVLLLAHADTFPADPAAWRSEAPPYDGALSGEHVTGRGALDMHGPLALMTLALEQLARGGQRTRDVLLLVTAGGEGDNAGIERAALSWPRVFEAEVALGEGGFVLQDWLRAGEDVVMVSHAEKGRLLLRLHTRGESMPPEHAREPSAPGRLVRALQRVLGDHPPRRLPDEVLPTASALLAARGGLPALLGDNAAGLSLLARGALEDDPLGQPLLASSCGVVSLGSGAPVPVVPPWAEAIVDCRLLPGDPPSAFRDRLLLAIGDPRVELEVLDMAAASGSPPDGAVIDVIQERMRRESPSIPLLPALTAARTELGWLRARGVPAYGFSPIRVDREELASLHGPNERVRVRELEEGLSRLVDVIAALARLSAAP